MTNQNQTQKAKLEILVVEDKTINQESARFLLKNHNVSIAGDFVQAIKILAGAENEKSFPPYLLSGRTTKYDVLLSDMMFPLGGGEDMPCRDTYSEQPLGYSLSLIASRLQVPKIAILTDMNHHSGPIAATFDFIFERYGNTFDRRPIFTLNKTDFMMFDSRDIPRAYLLKNGKVSRENILRSLTPNEIEFPEDIESDYIRKVIENDSRHPEGYGFDRKRESFFSSDSDKSCVKNWKAALDILLNGYPEKKTK